ncbi:FMRFamide receptor-like isoform X2 [Pomacea canaliculata]|nr:FMRFamide receptor-like isoform X2 [Pomacea canaliculata]
MTEIFTTGPHLCGKYDPTITGASADAELSTDSLIFYCTVRNIYGIFASLIAILGIIGNIISLVILPKTGVARSAIVFLQSLGVYDTVFLASGLFLRNLPSVSIVGHSGVVLSNALSPLLFPLTHISHIGAIYSTICISGERCIAVAFPLHAVRILTMKRVKILAGVILVWSILFNVPRYLMLEPTRYWEPSLNRTWIRLEPSVHSLSSTLLFVFFGYVTTIVKVVVPVIVVSVLNVILLCCLRRRRHYLLQQQVRTSSYDSYHAHYSSTRSLGGRHALGRGHWGGRSRTSQASSHRVTSVVLAITSVFLLSQLFAAAQVLIHLLGYEQLCGHPCAVFTQICDTVFILVSATNFLLYYAFGENFRKIIRKYLCCRRVNPSVDSM